MKRSLLPIFLAFCICSANSQTKNFIDQPYIEVNGVADTLVMPDQIFIRIYISEKDTKDRISVEELEQKMVDVLKGLGLSIEKDLVMFDLTSAYKTYLLKGRDIVKTKQYHLQVADAGMATRVFAKLEDIGISSTSVDRVAYSQETALRNRMRTKAIIDARSRAIALTSPLNQTVGSAIHISDEGIPGNTNEHGAQIRIRGISSINSYNHDKELTKLEFEKIRIATAVNVKFILK